MRLRKLLVTILTFAVLIFPARVFGGGTLQTANGLWWPELMATPAAGAFTAFALDAAADRVSAVFRCPKAGNLGYTGFRTGTVTTSEALKISFQTIDPATGNPDDTPDEYRAHAGAFAANTWYTTGLITSDGADTGTKRTVARGEYVGVTIQFNAFSAGNMQIAAAASQNGSTGRAGNIFSYITANLTGAYAKQVTGIPLLYLQYDDDSTAYMPWVWPFSAVTSTLWNNTSDPAERALRFQVPFKCTSGGAWLDLGNSGNTGAANLVLYASDGTTVLLTEALDPDIRVSTYGYGFVWFSSEVTLSPATTYYLALDPTSATNTSYNVWTVPAIGAWDQTSCGQACYSVYRTTQGSGAWTEETTKRPMMGLIITALDDGASTGGGVLGRVVSQ